MIDGSLLTTSGINSLINQYETVQRQRRISPLEKQKSAYKNKSSAYSSLSSKLDSFKTVLYNFKQTGSSSEFLYKTASSSDESFVKASATTSAGIGTYNLRVTQLAKSDIVISKDIDTSSTSANSLGITDGTYKFQIKTGDGSTGEYTANVEVDLNTADTNEEVMEAIRDAINSDKAIITSTAKSGTYSGGSTSFDIDINGTTTTISDSGGGTYEDLIDRLVSSINADVDGVTAEKVTSGSSFQLKLTVDNTNNYISITHNSGFDLVSDLNISATKEKAASGIVSASVYSPATGSSQFSITSKNSGLDYRIKSLSDTSGTALNVLGLNLGTSRPTYDQSTSPDTPGFLYADTTSSGNKLNAKITFNGVSVQRNSNTISDLATGVTFELKSVMQSTDNDVVVGVDADITKIKEKLQDFIDKFNDVYSYIKNNSLSDNGVRGPFIGDPLTSTLRTKMTNTAYGTVSGLPSGAIDSLAEVGITFSTDVGLTISDDTALEDAIKNKNDELESLFNSSNGIANSLYDLIDPYLGSAGYITNRQDSYDSNVTYLNDRIESIQKSIDKSSENLRKKYEQMQNQLIILLSSQSFMNSIGGGFF